MHEQDDQQDDNGSCYKWAWFIIGHILLSVAVIYAITQLSVCFEKNDDNHGRTLYVCMYVWSSHIAEYGSTG